MQFNDARTAVIEQINKDFEQRQPPFDAIEFPEERFLSEIGVTGTENTLRLISAFCTFDYNRTASQLVDNLIKLYETEPTWFIPESLPNEDTVAELFSELGFRYPTRDAHGWVTNNQIIIEKYNSQWREVLGFVEYDAHKLVEQLYADDFLYLKGDKIAPMYARIIDNHAKPLNNLWGLEIPVDTHIRRLSTELMPTNSPSDDDIRAFWRNVAHSNGIERHVIDGALWQIGNNWNEWGEKYWKNVTNS